MKVKKRYPNSWERLNLPTKHKSLLLASRLLTNILTMRNTPHRNYSFAKKRSYCSRHLPDPFRKYKKQSFTVINLLFFFRSNALRISKNPCKKGSEKRLTVTLSPAVINLEGEAAARPAAFLHGAKGGFWRRNPTQRTPLFFTGAGTPNGRESNKRSESRI